MSFSPPAVKVRMEHVNSSDGTVIAFDRIGSGPPLILVVGAFNTRSTGEPLAAALASRFSVFTYDRRGRGDSGDTLPYTIEREVADLAALIAAAGGEAAAFGYSSGGLLALRSAADGLPISKLVLYDTPYVPTNTQSKQPMAEHAAYLQQLVDSDRRGEAVEYFQSKLVGVPDEVVAQLRHAPFRPALESIAHTLVYDAMLLEDRSLDRRLGDVPVPTLVVAGGENAFMTAAAQSICAALPNANAEIIDGQTHDINPSVLGPVLDRFLSR
jgi:pimeloyl-ACP methyl ester carboxylesterase